MTLIENSSLQLEMAMTLLPEHLKDFRIELKKELTENELESCFQLLSINMKKIYKSSSFGWDPSEKLKEMSDTKMHYLLLYSNQKLIAFLSFQFTTEIHWEENQPDREVIYCYECQVDVSQRRKGIGLFLMNQLEQISKKYEYKEIMLTVFKKNKNAYKFYLKLGYELDPISPEDVDYLIMSQNLS